MNNNFFKQITSDSMTNKNRTTSHPSSFHISNSSPILNILSANTQTLNFNNNPIIHPLLCIIWKKESENHFGYRIWCINQTLAKKIHQCLKSVVFVFRIYWTKKKTYMWSVTWTLESIWKPILWQTEKFTQIKWILNILN